MKSGKNGKAGSQTRQHRIMSKTTSKNDTTVSYTFPAGGEGSAVGAVCLPAPGEERNSAALVLLA